MRFPLTRTSLRLTRGAAVCAGVLGLSGCGGVGFSSGLGAAQVRFVDVSPGSPEMDFYVNGTGAAYSLGYANFTSYLQVSPGVASLSAHRAGAGQSLAASEMNLASGRQYTAVLCHGPGAVQERIYPDQDTPAPPGEIALRVLDEVDGGGTVTVYVSPGIEGAGSGAPAAVLSLSVGAASGYVNLPMAAAYTLTATVSEGALHVPVGSVTVKAGSGAVRTVVFAGVSQVGSKNVAGFVLDDADVQ